MAGLTYLRLLLFVFIACVGADESAELYSSAVKAACGASASTDIDNACLEKVVKSYFQRFNWCQSTYASCFLCNATQLTSLAGNLFTFKGAKATMNLTDFTKVSVALLALTHDIKVFCNANTVPSKTYPQYWADVSGEIKLKPSKSEWLEHVFEDLGTTFNSSRNTKCINNTLIVLESEAAAQTNSEGWAQRVSLFSVLHVLNEFQLDVKCTSVPNPASIRGNLLMRLGLPRTATRVTEAAMTKLFKLLGIVPTASTTSSTHDHSGHNHRRKRSAEEHRRVRRAITIVASNVSQCLTVDQMFHAYGVDESLGASHAQFEKLCPAVLEQKLSDSCKTKKTITKGNLSQAFGFGTLAVLLISCGSLLGAILVPCMKTSYFDLIMLFFLAMSVGTLVTDSLLHLVPEALGLHNHAAETAKVFTPPEPYFWKLFLLICTLFILYLVELAISSLRANDYNAHQLDSDGKGLHGHSHFPMAEREQRVDSSESIGDGKMGQSSEKLTPKQKVKNSKLTAFMILAGDCVHNFADGLAIGAAFAAGLSSGISTSIAILCHELPHEIGDFVVLLSADFSVRRALLFNFLSALSAFVGLYIGIPISTNDSARVWIFAITAAVFLYIALADMLPAIRSVHPSSKAVSFAVQASGIFVGVLLIFLLGLFESLIHI